MRNARRMWLSLGGALVVWLKAVSVEAAGDLIVVVGAPGQAEYEKPFYQQAKSWQEAAQKAGWNQIVIGLEKGAATNDLEVLRMRLADRSPESPDPIWIVLIGHGTFDGKTARFNLRGPDLLVTNLAAWLKPIKSPTVIINTASSSAPFLNELSATNRLVLTATRSGHEQNYTRFGEYLVEALDDLAADLDKDEQVSLLEAFLFASRRTGEFYKTNGRLATEHALLDDNGDRLGTPAEWYQGLRATKKPDNQKAAVDGMTARRFHLVPSESDRQLTPEQIKRRDELERAVLELRDRKASIPETEYYQQLERHLLDLALLYQP